MITFNCPHCNHTLNIPDQYAGQNGTCNHCKKAITAPRTHQSAASPGVALNTERHSTPPLSPFEGGAAPPRGDVPPDSRLQTPDSSPSPFEGGRGDVPPPFSQPNTPMGAVDLNNLDINPDNYVRGIPQHHDDEAPRPRFNAAKIQWTGLQLTCAGCAILTLGPVFLIFLFAFLGALTGDTSRASSTSTPTRAATASSLVRTTSADVVTLAEFNALRNGMSYAQAVQTIGAEGTVMSENTLPDFAGGQIHTIMYMWQNPGGANMNAMFQNDALIQKSQFGLK